MKNLRIILSITVLIFSITGCTIEKGDYITTELKFEEFEEIIVDLDANVFLSQGEEQEIIVKGFESQIENFKISLDGKTLNLDTKNGINVSFDDKELEFHITIPKINLLKIKSSAEVQINNFEQSEKLNLEISGSGEIELNQFNNLKLLDVDISGSGELIALSLIDSLESLNIDISGSGEFNGFLTHSKNANVNISGSGDVSLTALDNLNINISGSGTVNYKGFPNINSNISGSGSIKNTN
ncbi:MAG: head GIN domain-containing protein [Chitinophagales bacterium]